MPDGVMNHRVDVYVDNLACVHVFGMENQKGKDPYLYFRSEFFFSHNLRIEGRLHVNPPFNLILSLLAYLKEQNDKYCTMIPLHG